MKLLFLINSIKYNIKYIFIYTIKLIMIIKHITFFISRDIELITKAHIFIKKYIITFNIK